MQYSDEKSTHEDGFIWENSGLYEGDILLLDPDRNVLIDHHYRWSNATIPFYIEEDHFDDEEIKTILSAVHEFQAKTCLRLKPYQSTDENWIIITGNEGGCWSSVGMRGEGGQQLNVHAPQCVQKGVVIHEMLHAAGFYHQQSAANRDDFVEIKWENIDDGHASNFNKYNSTVVTDYSLGYDYESIMHYSSKAFSKNGKDTIVAKKNITKLGQREGFTEKDVLKLNRMYEESCQQPVAENEDFDDLDLIHWFSSLLNT